MLGLDRPLLDRVRPRSLCVVAGGIGILIGEKSDGHDPMNASGIYVYICACVCVYISLWTGTLISTGSRPVNRTDWPHFMSYFSILSRRGDGTMPA